MSAAAHEDLAALFERVVALSPAQREAVLAVLDPPRRGALRALLDADGDASDPIASAIDRSLAGDAAPGRCLGDYRVLRELGAGGMGTVLLAERADGQYSQRVAIKLIRGFPTVDGQRRLRQERQILAALDHPNIARLLDGGETADGQPYVVMEYVQGRTLLEYVAAGGLDRDARLALFDRIAAAVQHAHQRLVIHRDIKPANVLVRDDGDPKLLDFGVARLVDESAQASPHTSTRVWTPGYASPEQRNGGAVTTATDVYGLGVLLHEMLTGRRRADAGPATAGVAAVAVDADLAGIVSMATADEPSHRYATVEAMRADLQRWRDGRPVRAARDTVPYRARKFVRRHRWAVAGALLASMALTGFVYRLDVERDRALAAEAAAQQARVAAERDAGTARASLAFLAGTFQAAAPDQALDTQVTARSLLDHARARLDTELAERPELRAPLQRLLGHLYVALGEATIAERLLAAGLAGAQATSSAEALALAADFDAWSSALGVLERADEALGAAERARSLRLRHAPDDADATLASLAQLGYAHYAADDHVSAARVWEDAIALIQAHPGVDPDQAINVHQMFANLLAENGEIERSLALVDAGLRIAAARVQSRPSDRVTLLRAKAQAMQQAGRYAEAEALLREAIGLQAGVVGEGGLRMSALQNNLGVVLNQRGRYREAVAAMERGRTLSHDSGAAPADEAISLNNIAAVYENAGDYGNALALHARAERVLADAGIDPDDGVARRVGRNLARTLALAGRHDEAARRFAVLRERAATLDGEESVEYAMLTWQQVVLARRSGDAATGLRRLDEARRRFTALVPESHPIFAHMHRARADFARLQGDLGLAEREQRAALARLEVGESLPVDLAIARAELAAIRWRQGDAAAARALLGDAMPVLRETLLSAEVARATAEALAGDLGLPAPAAIATAD